MGGGGGMGEPPQGHIVFAYNIGPMTSEVDVRQLFELYGSVVKVDVIWDYAKNMGKGYAFVTMPNYEEAEYAITQLDGYNYAGKPLQVSFKSAKQQ
jgi:ELAV like protein 2/3/4